MTTAHDATRAGWFVDEDTKFAHSVLPALIQDGQVIHGIGHCDACPPDETDDVVWMEHIRGARLTILSTNLNQLRDSEERRTLRQYYLSAVYLANSGGFQDRISELQALWDEIVGVLVYELARRRWVHLEVKGGEVVVNEDTSDVP